MKKLTRSLLRIPLVIVQKVLSIVAIGSRYKISVDGGELERLAQVRARPDLVSAPARFEHDEPELDLSIIVPVYNVGRYLDECLSSLLDGEVDYSYEVIAINDGSTDDSPVLLSRWMARSGRLKLISQPNRGLSAARNVGLDICRGEHIVFVDSDDVCSLKSIGKMLDILKTAHCDYVSGTYVEVDEEGVPITDIAYVSEKMVPWGRVYRREVWNDIRFPLGCWYEDIIVPYLVESRFRSIDVTTDPYLYRQRSGSIVSTTYEDPRGLDSFWLVGYMLSECKKAGISLDQDIFDVTLRLMGPMLAARTQVLDSSRMQDVFISCCEVLTNEHEFDGVEPSMGGHWLEVEQGLRERNIKLWVAGLMGLAIDEGSIGLRLTFRLVKMAYFKSA